MSYEIRSLHPDEMQTVVSWALAEGWKPGLHDLNAFLAVDPSGFLGGFLDGELVSSISAIRYPDGFAFVGFYIVRPGCRGKGLGYRLWQAAMERLSGFNMGLDGVTAQVDNYAKSGFRLAHPNRRYVLESPAPAVPADGDVVDARVIPLSELAAFDRRFFPAARRDFLAAWLSQPERRTRAIVRGGRLVAYGVARPCDGGQRIGPLFAEASAQARDLFLSLAGGQGQPVFLDVPVRNSAAVAMVNDLGMSSVFDTARMYSREEPVIEHDGVFGITSLELG
ncbi:GNAT family N-acetyltransferase [bacterium]|nr:GNAT family N-acetyltransferase [bacterium]